MKFNKIIITALTALLVLGQAIPALAADTVITLDASARDFVKMESDEDFQGMEPGEQRTAEITLTNSANDEMSFYISGEIVNNLADTGDEDQWAVYDLLLYKGTEDTPFFEGTIGSAKNKELERSETGLNYLKDDTLLATLKKGESTTVRIMLKLDGDSTGNSYENKAGEMKLNISASIPTVNDPGTIKKTVTKQNIIQKLVNVKTGDGTPIGMIILIAGAAVLVIIILLVIKHRRSKKEE